MEQVGNPSTLKGAPNFMQDCNNAWHNTTDDVRNAISSMVFLDGNGNVTRIGPPLQNADLMAFVRTFAEGLCYIGHGAWMGDAGDSGDNSQVCCLLAVPRPSWRDVY